MSEKIRTPSPERRQTSPEHNHGKEQQKLKELKERAENASEISQDQLSSIKQSIEKTALSGKEYTVGEKEHRPAQTSAYPNTKELKQQAYRRTIKKAQSHLRGPEKSFSKAIHNPTVERVSDVAAKTIARPSGFLLGSICAFIASSIILYISKRSGFTYNYLLFVIVFAGGYVVGVIIELALRPFRKS